MFLPRVEISDCLIERSISRRTLAERETRSRQNEIE